MTIWAVVPVKSFETAKSRLSGLLSAGERATLAREMLAHVLSVLSAARSLAGIVVVTDSSSVAEVAKAGSAVPVFDPPTATALSDCVDFGLEHARHRGATAGLVLMSDLPALTPESVGALLGELDRFDVVVVRDGSGLHTNALGIRLETPFKTSFGSSDSFQRHCDTAKGAGLTLSVPVNDALAFDVDTPEDYERLLRSRR